MHVVLLCGSLRQRSSNRALLEAYRRLAAPDMKIDAYAAIERLPHFNPDIDDEHLPEAVLDLRLRIATADAVVVSTPEYAHGLPGSFKNVLDWLVGDPAFAGKRVAILHIDRDSRRALDSLREVLRTMAAQIDENASVLVPLASHPIDPDAILAQPAPRRLLERSMAALAGAMQT